MCTLEALTDRMHDTIQSMHDNLCVGGAIPVVGPFVSIAHGVISITQVIAALAATILVGVAMTLACHLSLNTLNSTVIYLQLGLGSLIYSIINILSLGIFAYQLKSQMEKKSSTLVILGFLIPPVLVDALAE